MIRFEDGVFSAIDSNQALTWSELAQQAGRHDLPHELAGGLRVRRDNEMHTPVFPNGTCICEIEIDPETGAVDIKRYATVDDVGRCINPLIVHGQTHGGIAQGVGQALWEHCTIDPSSGQPLAGSLMDYGMPRFDNLPSFKTEIAEVLSPTNPFGVKAGGEGGTTPAPGGDHECDRGCAGGVRRRRPSRCRRRQLKIWSAIHEHSTERPRIAARKLRRCNAVQI